MTTTAAPDEQAPAAIGVSPARDAWRRLRRNRLAMAGLALVALVVVATVAAPLITGDSPTRLRPWIGAQPPGFSHPDCAAENIFTVGRSAESVDRVLLAHAVAITARESRYEDYRIALRRGVINTITRVHGGEAVDQLDLSGERRAQVIAAGGGVSGERRGAVLKLSQAPPTGWFAADEKVLMLRVEEGVAVSVTYRIALDHGVVRAVERAGEAVMQADIRGEEVVELMADGRPLTLGHPLGTDLGGRDLWARILYGGRISLMVGVVATAVSLVIGVLFGAVAGYVGGRTDRLMMSGVDILYAIPFMFLVIVLLVNFGRSLLILFIALGAVQWLTMARIVRGQVLSLAQREFVAAARMCGAGHWTIITRHLIPNALGPVIVFTTLTVPAVILQESFLAFIGLAVQYQGQNLDSWGALVKAGVDALDYHGGGRAWLLVWPSAAMALTLLALNCLGDGLRDALDPQMRGRT